MNEVPEERQRIWHVVCMHYTLGPFTKAIAEARIEEVQRRGWCREEHQLEKRGS